LSEGPGAAAGAGEPSRAARFFEDLARRPRFVVPTLVLTACTLLYVEVAVREAFPLLVPQLLDRALVTESVLRADLHRAFRTAALLLSPLAIPLTAAVAWGCLAPFRARQPYARILALVAHASLAISAGIVVKALLVLATGQPDPPVNLGAFARAREPLARGALAITNPFGILAAVATVAGLRAFGASRRAAATAGVVPWAAWMAGLAVVFGGASRLAPKPPVDTDGWPEVSRGSVTLRHAPDQADEAESLLDLIVPFSGRLEQHLGIAAGRLRIYVYPDHATLERATGDLLHVLVTGSIRGADLLYLEMPGRSVAVPRDDGLREALRWVGLVRLAPAASGAPRWFVEGFVHAAVHPGSPELEREFRSALARSGVPTYEQMLDPTVFRTPEGPLLARSLVDHVAFVAGTDAPERILRDVVAGTPFRDALFRHARLTTGALEAGWTDVLRAALAQHDAAPSLDGS
jgi:hypothetical protein